MDVQVLVEQCFDFVVGEHFNSKCKETSLLREEPLFKFFCSAVRKSAHEMRNRVVLSLLKVVGWR